MWKFCFPPPTLRYLIKSLHPMSAFGNLWTLDGGHLPQAENQSISIPPQKVGVRNPGRKI
jgi:hypothetical protein